MSDFYEKSLCCLLNLLTVFTFGTWNAQNQNLLFYVRHAISIVAWCYWFVWIFLSSWIVFERPQCLHNIYRRQTFKLFSLPYCCTLSKLLYTQMRNFFVSFFRCQDQSMHYDGKKFIVRYNGNSAGFDKNDFLIVY